MRSKQLPDLKCKEFFLQGTWAYANIKIFISPSKFHQEYWDSCTTIDSEWAIMRQKTSITEQKQWEKHFFKH